MSPCVRYPVFQVFSFPGRFDAVKTWTVAAHRHTLSPAPKPSMGSPLSGPESPAPGHFRLWLAPALGRPHPPRRGDRGISSVQSQSTQRRNSLCSFKNTNINAQILKSYDGESSGGGSVVQPSRRARRKKVKTLYLICAINNCICDC